MKLYVANCTDQDQIVNVRIPERKNFYVQTIYIGRQVIVGAAEMSKLDIDAIIEQLGVYGGRSLADFEHAREQHLVVPLLHNIDQLVPHEMHMRVVEWNRSVLAARGKKLREDAAIATSVSMRERSPNAADNLWVSVQEEKAGTMEYDGPPINDGVRMERPGA